MMTIVYIIGGYILFRIGMHYLNRWLTKINKRLTEQADQVTKENEASRERFIEALQNASIETLKDKLMEFTYERARFRPKLWHIFNLKKYIEKLWAVETYDFMISEVNKAIDNYHKHKTHV